jgi:hypothetical protein
MGIEGYSSFSTASSILLKCAYALDVLAAQHAFVRIIVVTG